MPKLLRRFTSFGHPSEIQAAIGVNHFDGSDGNKMVAMVAIATIMLRFALKLLLVLFIKRRSFVTSNSVCYSFHDEEINENAATFI